MLHHLLLPFQKNGRKILRTIQGLMQSGYTLGEIQSLIAKMKREGSEEEDAEAWRKEMPPLSIAEDPVFREFEPWSGEVPPGYSADFVGQVIDEAFLTGDFYPPSLTGATDSNDEISGNYPPANEEVFEWQFLLSAILDARRSFSMIEAGAGFGRWSVAAACALRQRQPGIPFKLWAVEAEQQHFEWLRRNFANNGIAPEEHHLVRAAVSATDGDAFFVVGHAQEWYGQAIVTHGAYQQPGLPESHTIRVPTLSIETLLAEVERIDLMDFDIQGAEGAAIKTGIQAMTRKVKRVFVSTHGPEIDRELPPLFRRAGWYATSIYRCAETQITPFGEMAFRDGVQCWINPNIQ